MHFVPMCVKSKACPKIRDGILGHAGGDGLDVDFQPILRRRAGAGAAAGLATTTSTDSVGICEASWARLRRRQFLFGVKQRESAAPESRAF